MQNISARLRLDRWEGVLIVLAVFAALLLSPFLFFGQAFLAVDAHYTYYPLLTLFKTRLWSGDFLWNDLNFHGFPMGLGITYQWHLLLYPLIAFLSPITTLHWGSSSTSRWDPCLLGMCFDGWDVHRKRLSSERCCIKSSHGRGSSISR